MPQSPQTPPAAVQRLLADGAAAGAWQLDPAATTVRITSKSMWGLVTAHGTFGEVAGEGTLGADGAVEGRLTLGAGSLDTANAKRDKHLRSADFFDVDNHPEIVVRVGGSVDGATADGLPLSAEATVKGATRVLPVTATVTPEGSGTDAVRLTVRTVVDHREFGIVWSPMGMMRPHTDVAIEALFRRA
ncbi:YceI family protein [Streptomyces sp. NPDC047002]|uniref:YceI family protein n=1 Tax=Streptomyces sp. NPDC047002 TaxID=3155475 RepID=UPI0034515917